MPEYAGAVSPQTVVVVLAGDPCPYSGDLCGGLLRELSLDVHVLGIDSRRARDVDGCQDRRVIQGWPLVAGHDIGCLAQWRELTVVLKHPRVDMLAGEQVKVIIELRWEHPLG